MKIAFVGKGGSGKSSVSWLVTKVLEEAGHQVLAVDADHNMDLAHVHGAVVDDAFPTLHRAHDRFRSEVGQAEDRQWQNIVLDGRPLPTFRLSPKDDFTSSVTKTISPQLDLMVVGLGAHDVLFSSRCAHGHSAPLKYYLPLLQLNEHEYCVIDGVAGVDMMNFGLFVGADAVVVVVEPHTNSLRVFTEVARIAESSGVPVYALLNKTQPNATNDTARAEVGEYLIGELPIDQGVLTYDYNQVKNSTKKELLTALERIQQKSASSDSLERLRTFEQLRQQARG